MKTVLQTLGAIASAWILTFALTLWINQSMYGGCYKSYCLSAAFPKVAIISGCIVGALLLFVVWANASVSKGYESGATYRPSARSNESLATGSTPAGNPAYSVPQVDELTHTPQQRIDALMRVYEHVPSNGVMTHSKFLQLPVSLQIKLCEQGIKVVDDEPECEPLNLFEEVADKKLRIKTKSLVTLAPSCPKGNHTLYHIREAGSTDLSQGYIGVTSNYAHRARQHATGIWSSDRVQTAIKRTQMEIVPLATGIEKSVAYELEHRYRPEKHIGLNGYEGGQNPEPF